jgi:hypothetical protein
MAYRDYTADGSYWTVRKSRDVYWVVLISRVDGDYQWKDIWGGYKNAGAAGGAAAQLAYTQAKEDVAKELRGTLHEALNRAGLGALPKPAPVKPDRSKLPSPSDDAEE